MSRIIDADKLKQHYSWWPADDRAVFDSIVDQQPTANEWIRSSERVPDTDDYVLCVTQTQQGRQNIIKGYYHSGRWCCGMNSNVTHWMPMPELPEVV